MKTLVLTTNEEKNIEKFAYMIVRENDGAILYMNEEYKFVYQEFCELALGYMMRNEMANFIIK